MLVGGSLAHAAPNAGFNIARYTPTAAGEWSFAVDHPWYTRSRYFAAAGLTFDYAHDPLVYGIRTGDKFTEQQAIIRHQLLAHVDLAASFLDRVNIAVSLPVVLYEGGTASAGVTPSGVAVGDLRIGLMVRLYGQPLRDAFSIHLGGQIWVPTNAGSDHAGEGGVSAMAPKLVLGGLTHRVLWSFTSAFFYRPDAVIGNLPAGPGNSVGPEFRFGAAISYMDTTRRFAIGPEAVLATVITDGRAFKQDFTSLELLAAGHYNIAGQVQVGLAVGTGLLREPGTPDVRALARIAYAPMNRPVGKPRPVDRDGDGIADASDACPSEPGPASGDPERHGCPLRDRDGDGVFDDEDACPDEAIGAHPHAQRRGCPDRDTDGDGVFDANDQCVDVPAGAHPDPVRHGCPSTDTDGDGVFDPEDVCVDVPAGPQPDPDRPGCPAPDADADRVPDKVDACPDKPGAPNLDPKKNGCPGLVELRQGQIVILQQVFFATNKDVILPKSFPVLTAVVDVLRARPEIRVVVEGHTDDRGKPAANLDLSDRRARSVLRFLAKEGILETRLESKGYGPTKPIASNKTEAGRSTNRRVEFHILGEGDQAK